MKPPILTAAAIVAMVAFVAGASPVVAQQTPSPSPTTSSATPTASPTPAASPSPTVVVNGRPCEVGTLINGFLIYQDPSAPPERLPVPIPSCVRPGMVTAPPKLYGLNLPADTYTLHLEPVRGSDLPMVVYLRKDSGQPAVTIHFLAGFSVPQPMGVRDPGDFKPAPFLPVPGIRYDFITAHSATWIDPSGQHLIVLDDPSLTLEQVASLLVPLQVRPPNTGSGAGRDRGEFAIPSLVASLALLAASTAATLALRRRAG